VTTILTVSATATLPDGTTAGASVTVDVVDGVASVRKLEAGSEEAQG
jgi:hypothetical protein